MARKNITELNALIDASFADNVTGQITPYVMREFQKQFAQAGTVFKNINGYATYADDQHTSGSPLVITSSTPSVFSANKSTFTEELPLIYTNPSGNGYWDAVNSKVILDEVGAFYHVKFTFDYQGTTKNNFIFVKLIEVGFDFTLDLEKKNAPIVSTSAEEAHIEFFVRASQNNIDYGIATEISTDDTSVSIYNKLVSVTRLY